jgi:hypothetical protein
VQQCCHSVVLVVRQEQKLPFYRIFLILPSRPFSLPFSPAFDVRGKTCSLPFFLNLQ